MFKWKVNEFIKENKYFCLGCSMAAGIVIGFLINKKPAFPSDGAFYVVANGSRDIVELFAGSLDNPSVIYRFKPNDAKDLSGAIDRAIEMLNENTI